MHDSLVSFVRAASRDLVREWDVLKDRTQVHTLIEIARAGSLKVKDLAELLLVDESTASRTAKSLVAKKLAVFSPSGSDKRVKLLRLTERGRKTLAEVDEQANRTVRGALDLLDARDREVVAKGLDVFAKALKKARRLSRFRIRPATKADNPKLEKLIKTVMPEFGADGPGYAIHDDEVSAMYDAYRAKDSHYLVVEKDGEVVGGAGIAPLKGGQKGVCELRKMYFLPQGRGHGLGNVLLQRMLDKAASLGYKQCYLETLERMESANRLYQKLGFTRLKGPMGETGHFSCDRWYVKELAT